MVLMGWVSPIETSWLPIAGFSLPRACPIFTPPGKSESRRQAMRITPNQGTLDRRTLGAKVEGIDLAKPLEGADFASILQALGTHSVLHFPKQQLDALSLKAFSE